jgi:hypothetical protein
VGLVLHRCTATKTGLRTPSSRTVGELCHPSRVTRPDSLRSVWGAGFVVLPGVLCQADVAAFVEQIEAELAVSGAASAGNDLLYDRAGPSCMSLHDRKTWPRGKERRVVECAPFPLSAERSSGPASPRAVASHWNALRTSPVLARALDRIVGPDCWEMPFNGEHAERHPDWSADRPARHWYFPIVFPEHEYAASTSRSGKGASTASDETSLRGNASQGLRKIHLHSWRDELAAGPFTSEAVDAPTRWQPVSRRRFRGKGWHIDVGPGFPNNGLRHKEGHPFQCVVLLLLLTDSGAGGGGTVMIPGSHRMVAEKLRCQGAGGISHEDLNAWCVEQVLDAIKAERLAIRDGSAGGCMAVGGAAAGDSFIKDRVGRAQEQLAAVARAQEPLGASDSPLALPREATQIVGKAGDVVLMHPLVVHCGSTNLSSRVRIMGNGMVRMKRHVFEQRGGMFFATSN